MSPACNVAEASRDVPFSPYPWAFTRASSGAGLAATPLPSKRTGGSVKGVSFLGKRALRIPVHARSRVHLSRRAVPVAASHGPGQAVRRLVALV